MGMLNVVYEEYLGRERELKAALSRAEERVRVLTDALKGIRNLFALEPRMYLRPVDHAYRMTYGDSDRVDAAFDALYAALSTPVPENQAPCGYIYRGGTQCGYTEQQCMHTGSPSTTIPLAGRHDYTPAPEQPAQPSAEKEGA